MIGDDRGLFHARDEMGDIHEWPWKMVVNQIGVGGQFRKPAQAGQGKTGRGEIQIPVTAMDGIAAEFLPIRRRIRRKRQHVDLSASACGSRRQLMNDLLDPPNRLRHRRLEEMQYPHETSSDLSPGRIRGVTGHVTPPKPPPRRGSLRETSLCRRPFGQRGTFPWCPT